MGVLSRQSLRRQILGAAALLLLPLLVASFISVRRIQQERRAEIDNESSSVATTAAAYIDEYLNRLHTLAAVLVRHPDVVQLHATEATRLFVELLREQPLTNIGLADVNGRIVASTLPSRDGVATSPATLESLRTGRPSFGSFLIGPVTGKPIALMAFPVRDTAGTIVGALSLSVDMGRLQSVLADIPLPQGSVITMVDQGNRVLVRTIEPEKYVGKLHTPGTSGGDINPTDWDDLDGVPRFHGSTSLSLAPWSVRVGIPQSELARRQRGLENRAIVIAGGAFVISMLLALWLATTVSRHLRQLRRATEEITAGNLTSPASAARAPSRELAELHDSFRSMAESLRDTRTRLDQQFEQERQLNDALQSLQRQVVRQERLAAVGLLASGVAHELNNPLQAIVGATELLERQAIPERSAEIGIVKAQSAKAVAIIRSLARFGGQQPSVSSRVSLVDVVEDVVRLQSPAADRYTIRVITEQARRERTVTVSPAEVEQVVLHFVLNARHAVSSLPAGEGRIEVQVTDVARWVRLEVRDNGSGVKIEDEAKLFQPFFTTKSVGEGTGLGLSVSYGIIHSHGGTIGYYQNEWGGATFFFELPCEGDEAMPHDDEAVLRRTL